MRPQRTVLSALCALALLASVCSALTVDVGGVRVNWDCSSDHISMKDGNELGGEEKPIEIVSLSKDKIEYRFSNVKIPAELSKVSDVCFGNAGRNFSNAVEAYDAGDYAAAVRDFESTANERGAQSVWAPQLARFLAGLAAMSMGDHATAERAFSRLLKDVPNAICASDAQKQLLQIRIAAGDHEGALGLLDQLLGDRMLGDRDRYDFLLIKAELLMILGRWSDAERTVKDAESLAGRLPSEDSKPAKLRCVVFMARISLGRDELDRAKESAERVLSQTGFGMEDERSARALAIIVLGDVEMRRAEKAAGDTGSVRKHLESAMERYLKVVAVYGGDEAVDRNVRGTAFDRLEEIAGPNRLNDKDVYYAAKSKAGRYGF